MSSNVTLKAIGLQTQPNQLELPPGALTEASNVVIRRDNVIEPRRGYKLYGNAMGSSSDRAKQLMTYKQRILRHYSNKLQYDSDGQGNFLSFCGNYLEPETGRRIRFIEANSNFYFTTSEGIKKISARTAADFTTACPFITQAGGIKALDLTARLGNHPGFLPPDSAVAYRVVWGYTDLNNNLILGTPSQRAIVYNPLSNSLVQDFDNLLGALDNVSNNIAFPSLINDGNYVSTLGLPVTASASEVRTNLIALTSKLDTEILYADQVSGSPLQISNASINSGIATINFSTGNPADYLVGGSNISLAGFTPGTGTLNGPQVVSSLFPSFSTTGDTNSGSAESTQITTVADVAGNLAGKYFLINTANNAIKYTVWYNVSGVGTDPNIAGRTSIQVNINTNDTANTVASSTSGAINSFTTDFVTSSALNVVTVTNSSVGATDDALPGTSGFTIVVVTQGVDANVITSVASTSGINVGSHITGTGIPANTFVVSIGVGQITISKNATSTNIADALSFDPGINFSTSATGSVNTLNATINSFEYEIFPQPAVPSTPPTNQQLVDIQNYLQEIITRLQSEPSTGTPPVISSQSQTEFISPVVIDDSRTVFLTITIPQEVTTNYFFQVYRSDIVTASGVGNVTDLVPNDEMKLVYEAFPTQADITAGTITIEDVTPDAFRGANLYTNETTGEGILQANDVPPFALDINRFKNVVFYANTRTRQRMTLNLLGVSNMIADYNAGRIPTITISDGTTSNTYTFVVGVQEVTDITTVADVAGNLASKYFFLNNANDLTEYYVWFNVSGVGVDPLISGKAGIEVFLNNNDSANTVALKLNNTLNTFASDFNASVTGNTVTVTNVDEGKTTDASDFNTTFVIAVTTQGNGEDAAAKQFLLSNLVSPAQAVDATARSIVRVLNSNTGELVYAYYLSGTSQVPGQILLEARGLSNNKFYIVGNNSVTGLSFNPDISPSGFISAIAVGNPTVVTTSAPHGLINMEQIIITNSNSTPIIDGVHTITYISPTQFSLNINVTVAGTRGAFRSINTAVASDNEALANRIYYSKYLQPEAVPIVNNIDVGAKDKAILRIFPLRDSLFVFKEDGLFRISGETAPFNLALFDSSVILLAPDSLDVSNNLLYGWTTQGIVSVSETGASNPPISRPIDTDILKLATQQYVNFKSATWGMGYESDNSYTVYTIQNTNDIYAQIGYRYSTLTGSWTTFDKTTTCGVINSFDDKQYLGAGDVDFLEQERKDFTRYDYADRELSKTLTKPNYFGNQLKLSTVTDIGIGDVVTQEQFLTVYEYNQILKKMDNDATLQHDYFSTLQITPGDELRIKVDALINKVAFDPIRLAQPGSFPASDYTVYESVLGSSSITNIAAGDPTVITSAGHGLQTGRIINITGSNSVPSIDGTHQVTVLSANTFTIPVAVTTVGTAGSFTVDNTNFIDIETSYNGMITLMNNDLGVNYNTYMPITNSTLFETIVTKVDILTKRITVAFTLDFISGPLTIFKTISSTIQWAPQTMGDSLSFKQFREATVLFENRAFASASLSFASDLLPAFQPIPFSGTGNGIFGYVGNTTQPNTGNPGFGYGFFGGISNSSPFRTLIPASTQRCRYLIPRFDHTGAREKFSIFGISLTGDKYSVKAYR